MTSCLRFLCGHQVHVDTSDLGHQVHVETDTEDENDSDDVDGGLFSELPLAAIDPVLACLAQLGPQHDYLPGFRRCYFNRPPAEQNPRSATEQKRDEKSETIM